MPGAKRGSTPVSDTLMQRLTFDQLGYVACDTRPDHTFLIKAAVWSVCAVYVHLVSMSFWTQPHRSSPAISTVHAMLDRHVLIKRAAKRTSRFLIAVSSLHATKETYAFRVLERAFKDFGLRTAIRTNNGSAAC